MLLGALVSSLAAQNEAVFPGDHASRDGSTYSSNYPFSYGVSRMMGIYESWDLAIPHNAMISRIGFRQDETHMTSTGYSIQLEMFMGKTVKTAANAVAQYDQNYTIPAQQVFTQKVVALPNLSPPNQRMIWIDLDTPFQYDENMNLVVEFRIAANSNSNQPWSYYLDRATFVSSDQSFGVGCPASGGATPALSSNPSYIGGNWQLRLANAPYNALGFLNIDFVQHPPILGDPFGAPGCWLLVRPFVFLGFTTSSGGSKAWNTPVPYSLVFYNFSVYSQALVQDIFVPGNTLGFISTNGDQITFGVEPVETVILSQGSTTATNGSVYRNYGVITHFVWQ